MPDPIVILTAADYAAILDDVRYRARRSPRAAMQLVVFRLCACCGLRAGEVAGLEFRDVRATIQRPYIDIRGAIAKRGRHRRVPLYWDAGTLADIVEHAWTMIADHATAHDRFVFSTEPQRTNALALAGISRGHGAPLDRHQVNRRFRGACAILGRQRCADIHAHIGRHSFVSHSLAAGLPIVAIRDAAGHDSLATTNLYAHPIDAGTVGSLFGEPTDAARPAARESNTARPGTRGYGHGGVALCPSPGPTRRKEAPASGARGRDRPRDDAGNRRKR